MPQMVDEAGNIWEVDAQGNPVSFVGKQGAQAGGMTIGTPNPNKQRGDELRNQLTQAQIQKTLADLSKPDTSNAPKLPVGMRMKADGTGAEMIPGVPSPGANAKGDPVKAGAYKSVIQQIDRLYELYNSGIGATEGPLGLVDYLPTEANAMFDTAGAALGDQGNAAFKVPGMGAQSDADAARFVAANQPMASDRDAAALEKLRALRQRLEANMEAQGLPAPQWNYGLDGQPIQAAQQRDQMSPAGVLQQGPDRSNRADVLFGDPPSDSQNGGFVPYGAETRLERNPQWKGVNEAVKGMIVSGRPAQEIKAFMNSKGIAGDAARGVDDAINYYRKTGKQDFGVDVENIQVPMSGFDQFRNNAPQWQDPITGFSPGTAAVTGLNAGGFGIPQMLAGDEAFNYLREQSPVSAFAGDVAGMIGGTQLIKKAGQEVTEAGINGLRNAGGNGLFGRKGSVLLNRFANKRGNEFNRQLLADASFGAAYGTTTQGDPVTGALTAGLGSAGGQIAGKGVANAIGGVGSKAVQYLTDQKVPLSLGQTLGNNGIVGRNLQRMEQWPIIGDMMAGNASAARDRVYQGALQDAVAPTGRTLVGTGEDALKSAQGIKGQAYDDAYTGINAPIDMQYLNDVATPVRTGRNIYGDMGGEFDSVVKSQLRPLFGPNRALDGPSAQQFGQTVGDFASDFGGRGTAYGKIAADNMRGIGDATQDLIGRTNPGAIPKIQAANTVNARLTPIENASITANGKTPTPLQLRRAITSNTKNYGGRSAAATGKNVPDIVNYAADVLPQTIRDSGTAGNVLLPYLMPAALGGTAAGLGTFSDNPEAAGMLGVLAAMSTPQGAKALQAALVKRSPGFKKAGGMIGSRNGRLVSGSLGTGLALPFIE